MPLFEIVTAAFGAAFLMAVVGVERPRLNAVSGLLYSAGLLLGLGQPPTLRTGIIALATTFVAWWLSRWPLMRVSSSHQAAVGVSGLRSRIPRL